MENGCPEDTQCQYVTYLSGEYLGSNSNGMHTKRNRKPPHWFESVFRGARY